MAYKANLAFVYTRERKDFGRCCRFKVEGPLFLFNEPSNPVIRQTHMRQKPMSIGTQIDQLWGLHEVNTDRVPYKRRNENHVEGAWPKEINVQDAVMTARYAKKIERDDAINQLLPQLYERSYRWLIQNSALDIFDEFKEDKEGRACLGHPTCRKLNIYKDFSKQTRPCVSITFSVDPHKFASAYHDRIFQKSLTTDNIAYVWYLDNPNDIDMALDAGYPATVLTFSPRDSWSLAGGLVSGQVCYWDLRRGSIPVRTTPYYDGFRDPVSCLKWINTKDGMNVFSGSTDGSIRWWDLRNLDEPVEYLIVDTNKTAEELSLSRAWGVTALEYEPTISTKFMIGTVNGFVVSGNRKGKTMQEKLQTVFNCGVGPVWQVERNPYFLKNFLTVTDFSAKIWAEDFKEQAIMWSKPGNSQMIAGGWSPHRHSCFFLARRDGWVEAWDLIDMTDKPVLTFRASVNPLECMTVHPSGTLIATGSNKGAVIFLEMSKHFVITDKVNRTILGAMMDRESRREKLLEGKLRELRLKAKGAFQEAGSNYVYGGEEVIVNADNYFKGAVKEYEETGKVSKLKPTVEE